MNRLTVQSAVKALVCLHLALTASDAGSASEAPGDVEIVAGRGFLQWSLPAGHGSTTLSISHPTGEVESATFAAGVAPVLWLTPADGRPLADGTYTWELRVQPAGPTGPRATKAAVHFGYLTLRDGDVVLGDQPEPVPTPNALAAKPRRIAAPDQAVPDDLIVDGKACVGLACVNNEAFQSEALRLKQSVVRLRFEDTSSAGGFPARDWQLTANDSGSGGVNRFSLEDLTAGTTPFTVVGAAPSNALYVAGFTGNVGLGTAVPAQRLHLAAASTPAVRLEQTGGTVQTWDVGTSGTTFFVDNATNGRATLRLVDHPTYDNLASPVMQVTRTSYDGNPHLENMLRLSNYGGVMFLLDRTDPGTNDWQFSNFNTTFEISIPGTQVAQFSLRNDGQFTIGGVGHNSGPHFSLSNTGNLTLAGSLTATSCSCSSSKTLKHELEAVDRQDVLARLSTLPITKWRFKSDPEAMPHIGPTAEDFQAAFGLGQSGTSLNVADVNGVALAAIQALHAELQEQRKATTEQQRLLDEQRALIEELGQRLEQQGPRQP